MTRVLFSRRFDRRDRQVIKDDLIDYIVVDRRLSRELPVLGYYVEPDEAGAFTPHGADQPRPRSRSSTAPAG